MALLRRSTLIQAWRAPRLLLPTVLPARYAAAADLHTYTSQRKNNVCMLFVLGFDLCIMKHHVNAR